MADNGSTIKIGNATKALRDADSAWVTSQLNGQGRNVCILVTIRTDRINLTLGTAACGGGSDGGGAPPNHNSAEQDLIEAWIKRGLNGHGISVGDVVSFVNAAQRAL